MKSRERLMRTQGLDIFTAKCECEYYFYTTNMVKNMHKQKNSKRFTECISVFVQKIIFSSLMSKHNARKRLKGSDSEWLSKRLQ